MRYVRKKVKKLNVTESTLETHLHRDASYTFDASNIVHECDNHRYTNDKTTGKHSKNVYVWSHSLVNHSDLFKCAVTEIYQSVYHILRM